MTSVAEVQTLLRFLSQDAKVPVPVAMSKVRDLKEASLTTPETLSKAHLSAVQSIFPDEKLAKQILSAAKRNARKRTSSSASTPSPRSKRTKHHTLSHPGTQLSPAELEASLALPSLDVEEPALEEEIKNTVLHTNRAPLIVAFVLQLLKHTMPSQPLSSRLSLAQAVMSMGAKSKALNLGIQSGTAAGDEGWGEGQPKIKVMGREVRVMRRWGYEWQGADAQGTIKQETETETPQPRHHSPHQSTEIDSQETIKGDPSSPPPSLGPKLSSLPHPDIDTEPPLWALNLETLRSTSNTSALLSSASATSLPIYDPHSARAYLLKSFASAPTPTSASPNDPHNPTPASSKRPSPKKKPKRKNTTSLCSSTPWRPCSAAGLGSLDRKSWIAGLGDGMSE